MAIIPWASGYPATLDTILTNFPVVTDNVDEVLASHVNELASAVVELETIVGTGNLNFSPLAADYGAAVILSGSVTSAVVTPVIGGGAAVTASFPRDLVTFDITDPAAGTSIQFPITIPAPFASLPDRWSLNYGLIDGAPPVDYVVSISVHPVGSIADSINFVQSMEIAPSSHTQIIQAVNSGVVNAVWDFPAATYGNLALCKVGWASAMPFSAITHQLELDINYEAGDFGGQTAYHKAFGFLPSTGTFNTFTGLELRNISVTLFFPNLYAGTVTCGAYLDILKHPLDI